MTGEKKYDMVIFDMDGVLVDVHHSSWHIIHGHFGTSSDENIRLFIEKKIDDHEFMRRDISLWHEKQQRIHIDEIRNIMEHAELMPGLKETFLTLKQNGIKVAIISGGIDIMAQRICREIDGVDYIYINSLEVNEEKYLTGRGVLVVKLRGKDEIVDILLQESGISPERCAAVGDNFIDIKMFKKVKTGIAFNTHDQRVKESADIIIEKKDLREILKFVL